jgi:uncharacterized membrane protein (UPF0127 family)
MNYKIKNGLAAITLLALFSGCLDKTPPPTPPAKAEEFVYGRKEILLGGKTLNVEIADTGRLRMHGLMFRTSLADDDGMLFIFEQEQPLGFWMKNTLIPLSIAYFDAGKKIVSIHEMTPAVQGLRDDMLPGYESAKPAMYALEMNKNWFAKNKVKVGDHFEFKQTRP